MYEGQLLVFKIEVLTYKSGKNISLEEREFLFTPLYIGVHFENPKILLGFFEDTSLDSRNSIFY